MGIYCKVIWCDPLGPHPKTFWIFDPRIVCGTFSALILGHNVGDENWTQTLVSQTFWAPPGYPGKFPGYPAKKVWLPWFRLFEGHTELFGPHPFRWKTPTPPQNIRTQKFGFCALFSCLIKLLMAHFLLWFCGHNDPQGSHSCGCPDVPIQHLHLLAMSFSLLTCPMRTLRATEPRRLPARGRPHTGSFHSWQALWPRSALPQNPKVQDSGQSDSYVTYKWLLKSGFFRKPGDHPKFRKNALGVKRPFSQLSESFREFRYGFSECEIPLSEWQLTTRAILQEPQFAEPLPERFPKLMGTHMKDFHLPLHSRSAFFQKKIGVIPTGQIFRPFLTLFPNF